MSFHCRSSRLNFQIIILTPGTRNINFSAVQWNIIKKGALTQAPKKVLVIYFISQNLNECQPVGWVKSNLLIQTAL